MYVLQNICYQLLHFYNTILTFTFLRIGMKPELVLTEEDKKRRFKKFLKKKETERQNFSARNSDNYSPSSSESTPPPLEPLPGRFISPIHNNLQLLMASRNMFNTNFLMDKFKQNEMMNKEQEFNNLSLFPPFPKSNLIKFPYQECTPPPVSKDSEALNYFKSQGWLQSSTLVSPDQTRSYSFNQRNSAALFTQAEEPQDFSFKPQTPERRSVINFSFAQIKEEPAEEPVEEPENLSLKRSSADEDDERENNYVHKKFRVNSEKSDDEDSTQAPINLHQPQRRSVIMHARSALLA